MGLDLKVGKANYYEKLSSYSSFHSYRQELAKEVGVDLSKKKGFDGSESWKTNTPFKELLSHSDCGGIITYKGCQNLLEDFKKYKVDFDDIFFQQMHKQIKHVCKLAAVNKTNLEFC